MTGHVSLKSRAFFVVRMPRARHDHVAISFSPGDVAEIQHEAVVAVEAFFAVTGPVAPRP